MQFQGMHEYYVGFGKRCLPQTIQATSVGKPSSSLAPNSLAPKLLAPWILPSFTQHTWAGERRLGRTTPRRSALRRYIKSRNSENLRRPSESMSLRRKISANGVFSSARVYSSRASPRPTPSCLPWNCAHDILIATPLLTIQLSASHLLSKTPKPLQHNTPTLHQAYRTPSANHGTPTLAMKASRAPQ